MFRQMAERKQEYGDEAVPLILLRPSWERMDRELNISLDRRGGLW